MADYTRDTTEETVTGNGTNGHGLRASTASRFREEGAQLAETARDSALRAADERKSQAAGIAHDLSAALQKGSEHLHERGRDSVAKYFDLAAGAAEQFGSDLEGKDVAEVMDVVKDFARRRPTLMFGAALLVGFGVARFVMSARQTHDMSGDRAGDSLDATPSYDTLQGPGDVRQAQTGQTQTGQTGMREGTAGTQMAGRPAGSAGGLNTPSGGQGESYPHSGGTPREEKQ